jgi:hypothetical protein
MTGIGVPNGQPFINALRTMAGYGPPLHPGTDPRCNLAPSRPLDGARAARRQRPAVPESGAYPRDSWISSAGLRPSMARCSC